MSNEKIVCWWSGGVTSAVACKIAIDMYGKENCSVIFIDTGNEDDDTYRFMKDCEKFYGLKIESITKLGSEYESIQDVWEKYLSLNVASGAVCSSELKRNARQKWMKQNDFKHQVFGFDINEPKRVKGMVKNHSNTNPIFPLLFYGYDKIKCIKIIESWGLEIPRMYSLGFSNNNCFKTGCVQGGIGYWQKIMKEYPDKFDAMAKVEHDLTNQRGEPVTMLKDQSKEAIKNGNRLVFLKPHPDYPNHKDLTMMKGRPVEPLVECNGFCGPKDAEKEELLKNTNIQKSLF